MIQDYGWDEYIHKHDRTHLSTNQIGRVISVRGTNYLLMSDSGELNAELTGKLLFCLSREEQPKVGDWVKFITYESLGFITEILPRTNELFRKTPGKETARQVIAANIDAALIIQGLDHDFNPMRLERYIAQCIACNIKPIIILNKSDLMTNQQEVEHEVNKLQRNLPVYFCSTLTGAGIPVLTNNIFQPKKTYLFIGSSGVGKSSLINILHGNKRQKVNEISSSTGKGKHTTTTRELFRLPNGSLLIDTPGMREFGIGFSDDYNTNETFPVISKLAEDCKFRDCKHLNEEGCAIIEALQKNQIDPVVYESYLKLMREHLHFEKSIHDKKKEGKRFGRMVREVKDFRKKNKY